MALCPSCGSQMDDAASFCTSCGKRMPAVAVAAPAAVQAFCTSCGSKLNAGNSFCTSCGQPVSAASPALAVTQPVAAAAPAPITAPVPTSTAAPAPAPIEVPQETPAQAEAAPQYKPQISAPPLSYEPDQPSGGAFRKLVMILLLIIVLGAAGGWYFWGVETIVVCSPPNVTVYLDDKELQPTSYGRYVIPHLSRKTHLLKVQSPGFADTIQKLDFPLTSAHEWVNVTLVSKRRLRR